MWQELLQRQRSAGLPHALLLTGNKGIGKHELALHAAQWLLCQSPAQHACGECHSCNSGRPGRIPDFLLCVPEEGSRQIRIDAIRKVNEFLAQTPQISRCQVVILSPVEVMNINASNALLKTLEEPAGESYLLLETERFGSVLPTIRSRCQRLVLTTPATEQALSWLQQEGVDSEQASLALRLEHGGAAGGTGLATAGAWSSAAAMAAAAGAVGSRGELQPLAESWSKIEMSDVTSLVLLGFIGLSKGPHGGAGSPADALAGDVQALCDCSTLDPGKAANLAGQSYRLCWVKLLSGPGQLQ